jgi:putative nucleotidyltransferase with HDIG domain
MNNIKLNLYIAGLTLLAFGYAIYSFSTFPIEAAIILPIIFLTILAELSKVKVYMLESKEQVAVSWTTILSIGTLIGVGINEAIIVNVVSGIISSIYPNRLPIIKLLYNISSLVATLIVTFYLKEQFELIPYLFSEPIVLGIVVSMLYIFSNYCFAIGLMRILTGKKLRDIMNDMLAPHLPHTLLIALVGGLLGVMFIEYSYFALLFSMLFVALIGSILRFTAEGAKKRIDELEGSNKRASNLADELNQTLEEFIHSLTSTIDARDPYVYGHSMQVSNYALVLASKLKLKESEIEKVRIAGLLHDIGKISISEEILFKPGRLTKEEYEIIKTHAKIGEEILAKITSLKDVADIVGMHHERYDGKGYPYGLGGTDVPIASYIIAVSDTLDTILSDRSYKKGLAPSEALAEINRCKGTQFHPDVVDALNDLRDELGDDVFKNSAKLVDEAEITGQIISRISVKKTIESAHQIKEHSAS